MLRLISQKQDQPDPFGDFAPLQHPQVDRAVCVRLDHLRFHLYRPAVQADARAVYEDLPDGVKGKGDARGKDHHRQRPFLAQGGDK